MGDGGQVIESSLVMTDAQRPLPGSLQQACALNVSTSAQTDRQWFRRADAQTPRLTPPYMEPLALPLSVGLLDGYAVEVAAASRRRREAQAIADRMVTDDVTNRLTWITVEEKGA